MCVYIKSLWRIGRKGKEKCRRIELKRESVLKEVNRIRKGKEQMRQLLKDRNGKRIKGETDVVKRRTKYSNNFLNFRDDWN